MEPIKLHDGHRRSRLYRVSTFGVPKHAAGLKDGSIQPINRYTEETVAFEWTPEEAMIQRVLANPIAGYVFTRLTGVERRLEAASEQFSPFKMQGGEYLRDDNGNRIPENPKRAALLEDWLWSTLHPDDAMVFGPRSPMSTLNSSRRSKRW